jgi:hypothetical protein
MGKLTDNEIQYYISNELYDRLLYLLEFRYKIDHENIYIIKEVLENIILINTDNENIMKVFENIEYDLHRMENIIKACNDVKLRESLLSVINDIHIDIWKIFINK